jgi:ABC-type multidrug transport system fused ATPase/permease subunit
MPELPAIFARQRRWIFARLVVNGLFQSVSLVCSMLLVRHAFDVLLNPAFDDPEVHFYDLSDVWQIGFFAGGLFLSIGLTAWLRLLERVDAERLGQDYVHRVRLSLFDRMGKFAPRSLSRRSTGASMLRFVGDLNALRRWVSLGLARVLVAMVVTVFSLGFMAWLDLWLAAVVFVLLFGGLTWNLQLGPGLHRTVAEARRRRGRLAGNINEKISSFSVIQVFNQIPRERKRYSRQSRQLRDAMVDRARAAGRMRGITDGATAISMGMVLSLGAYLVFWGKTTSGNVVAAMAVVGFLSNAFRDLGRVHEYYQSAKVSREKILSFMNTRTLRGRSRNLPALEVTAGEVEFREVGLKGLIHGVSATAAAGARVALTGPNGAGKSTLLHIAARLIDPSSGQVLIDGQDLAKCNLESVRKAIGIVSPDLPLLRGSVRYNLRYRWPEAPEAHVAEIRTLCGLDEMVEGFPEGEDYRVLEGGQNLSLGQRHRLTLARALLGDPKVLMLDEVDANLDPFAAEVFARAMQQFRGTILMVSRSEARLSLVDQLWLLEDGRLQQIVQVAGGGGEQSVPLFPST